MGHQVKLNEMTRGEIPTDLKDRCLALCRSFIGGAWNEAKGVEEITTRPIFGGFTNQLYQVQLNTSNALQTENSASCPTEVAIKFYLPKHFKNYHSDDNERLNDVIILSMLSFSKLGISPKVFGIFHDGFIQEYIKNETFLPKHQQNLQCLKKCAQLQARLHSMEVPIRKDTSWLFRILLENVQFAYDQCSLEALIEELQLDAFQKQNPLEEVANLERLVKDVTISSPMVFSHGDFNRTNCLVIEDGQRVVCVDLEHCAYAPRAYDLATFMSEWDRKLLDFHTFNLPPDEVLNQYMAMYVDEADRLQPGYSHKPENSVEKIVNEVKVFILVRVLFVFAASIKQTESVFKNVNFSEETKMENCNRVLNTYLQIKKQLVEQKVIESS